MPKQNDTEPSRPPSDIDHDEIVILYPTYATRQQETDSWLVSIHGIVYEPERDSAKRAGVVRTVKKAVSVPPGSREEETLDERVRYFLVDNERGQKVSVSVGSDCFSAGESGPNGHFEGTFLLPNSKMQSLADRLTDKRQFLPVKVVTRARDRRAFLGHVQAIEPEGVSIISDIDDTIKHSQVGDHKEVLSNTFLREFRPIPGMPELYRDCAASGVAFHYVSGSPWQLYEPLAEFLRVEGFPAGSFHLKYFRLKDPTTAVGLLKSQAATKLSAIRPILESFPRRRFILIGDSGEQDPEIYGTIAREFAAQVVAVFIHNVTDENPEDARFDTFGTSGSGLEFFLFDDPGQLKEVTKSIVARQG